MKRQLAAAVVATAALGAIALPAQAAPKNTIKVTGGTVFKAGKFVKDDVRFAPADLEVKSGATVTVLNKGTDPAPHTISFVKKRFLPKSFEFAAIGPLMAAHQVDETNEEAPPGVIKVDNGAAAADQSAPLQVDSLGDDKQAGDSAVHRARPEEDHLQGDRQEGRGAPVLLRSAPVDAGQDHRQVARALRRVARGLAAAALPALVVVLAPAAAGAATRHVWVAAVPATWNAVPNARDVMHGTTFTPAQTTFPTVVYRRYTKGWRKPVGRRAAARPAR